MELDRLLIEPALVFGAGSIVFPGLLAQSKPLRTRIAEPEESECHLTVPAGQRNHEPPRLDSRTPATFRLCACARELDHARERRTAGIAGGTSRARMGSAVAHEQPFGSRQRVDGL